MESGELSYSENMAVDVMDVIITILRKKKLVKKIYVSPWAVSKPGGHMVNMLSDFTDAKGYTVGKIRVKVFVSSDERIDPIINIQWNRTEWFFWFSSIIHKRGDFLVGYSIRDTVRSIETTANKSIRLDSMIRSGYRKVKKKKALDKITTGLRLL